MTIEAAIVLPLLLTLTLALIEYGWVFYKSQHVTNAARQGARIGARADSTQTEMETAIAAALNNGGMTTYTLTAPDPDLLEAGETLTVTLRVSYDSLLGLSIIPTPGELVSTVVMVKEGL